MGLRSLWESGGTYTRPVLVIIAITWGAIALKNCEDEKPNEVVQEQCSETGGKINSCIIGK